MKQIVVKTQAEYNALPDKFDEYTQIIILGDLEGVYKSFSNAEVYVGGSATIKDVGGSATINYVRGSATINYVRDSATIKDVRMNAVISHVRSEYAVIESLKDYATVICVGDKCTIKKRAKTATVIVNPRVEYDTDIFTDIHKESLVGKSKITLYKSVNPDTLCDFYTGKIKYEGTVTCPDFDPNPARECGGGLHLSPAPELALRYNQGKVLKCEVALKDIVVYGRNIDKVRCRKVKVIGEA